MRRVAALLFACLVTVFASGCGGDSLAGFLQGAPSVTSVTPTSGHAGDTITIKGFFLTLSGGALPVTFNGVAAAGETVVTSGTSGDTITAVVPTGATTGPLIVTDPGHFTNGQLDQSSPVTFTVN